MDELDYNIEYIPGGKNVKADGLSRNYLPVEISPADKFEENIYLLEEMDKNFMEQVRHEQDADVAISSLKRNLDNEEVIIQGRFKRVQKQLRTEKGPYIYDVHLKVL